MKMKMKIEISHKKILCLFIFIVCALLCFGAFYNRQIAHATTDKTTQMDSDDQYDSPDQEEMKTDKKDEKKDSSFNFKKKMSFKVLKEAVANNEIDDLNNVPIERVYKGNELQNSSTTPTTIPVGIISEDTMPKIAGARFVGAYVVFPSDSNKETQIYYTNRYKDSDQQTYTYYAYSQTPETGVLLEGDAYIELKYEAAYDISYRVEDKKGKVLSNGLKEGNVGGYFVTPTTKLTDTQLNIHFIPGKVSVTKGNYHLRKLYKETTVTSTDTSESTSKTLKTPIDFDQDGAGSTDITQDTTIVAVVDDVDLYRMYAVNPFAEHHGHICWKGYSGWTYNSETGEFNKNWSYGPTDKTSDLPMYAVPQLCDPASPQAITVVEDKAGNKHGVCYAKIKSQKGSDYDTDDVDDGFQDILYTDFSKPERPSDQNKFCSYNKDTTLYDQDGKIVYDASDENRKAATTTAAPGGTFYFVMYTQRGKDWEFSRLSINGINLNTSYDGNVCDTNLNNGMVAHFKCDPIDAFDQKTCTDDHILSDRKEKGWVGPTKRRRKFECWVTHASSDIYVDFDCTEKETESLTLTKAEGVKRLVACSYDETENGNIWWDSLYNGKPFYRVLKDEIKSYPNSGKEVRSPNYEYQVGKSDDLPKVLFNEKDGGTKYTENQYHTRMESRNHYNDIRRYLYYEPLPGYDERYTHIDLTGAQNKIHDVTYGSLTSTAKFGSTTTGILDTGVEQGFQSGDKDHNNPANKALDEAITENYTNYIKYYSKHMRHRNISIKIDPYQYRVIYDLGKDPTATINGNHKYEDNQHYTIEKDSNHILMPTATPVRKGYVFAGWKYEPLNSKYYKEDDNKKQLKDEYASIARTLMPNEKFVINKDSYDWGLDTELENLSYFKYDSDGADNPSYTKSLTSKLFYVVKPKADNHFTFTALWYSKDEKPPKGKGIYTIKIYKQVKHKDYNKLPNDERLMKEGKYYHIESSNDYLGTTEQTIIGIPPNEEGYILNKEESIVKLKNFMNTKTKPEPNTLEYFYDFNGSQNLTIQNITSGNMGDQNQSFDVVVTLKDDDDVPFMGSKKVVGTNATIWGDKNSTGASVEGELKFDYAGHATIHLKGNQKITIKKALH